MDYCDVNKVSTVSADRRSWIAGAAICSLGFAVGASKSRAADDAGLSHNAEAIHQELRFKATPKRIYEVLLDEKQFQSVQLLSGAMKSLDLAGKPARIQPQPGGSFSLFANYIIGRQIELVQNQRVVQAWRAGSWDPGAYSIAKFELIAQDGGTRLVFDHTGFPAGTGEHLAAGWKTNYWEPLEKYLA